MNKFEKYKLKENNDKYNLKENNDKCLIGINTLLNMIYQALKLNRVFIKITNCMKKQKNNYTCYKLESNQTGGRSDLLNNYFLLYSFRNKNGLLKSLFSTLKEVNFNLYNMLALC